MVGDIHGHYQELVGLLQRYRLIDSDLRWSGTTSALWFLGDYVDLGPNGIEVIELVMRLQREAASASGFVGALLGNHEVLLLAAVHFGNTPSRRGSNFLLDWTRSGGVASDLARLTATHVNWLAKLPAMVGVPGNLLIHADAIFYTHYGTSIGEVNKSIQQIMLGREQSLYKLLSDEFSQNLAFHDYDPNHTTVSKFLEHFGSVPKLIHGHTPISTMIHQRIDSISSPLIYADGRCVNVDAGIYMGGRGFIYKLPEYRGL